IAPRDKSKSLHLGSVVWKPLANELNDARRIFFAPTGELHAMPLEHMLHWDGSGRSMAQAYDMYRLSSTREIALDDDNQALARATLFGGLTYGTGSTDDTPAMRNTAIPADDDDDAFADDDYNLRSAFQPLEGTRVEVSNISRFLAQMGVDYKIYTGTDGTEASFRAMAGNKLNLLHVATHGFYWTEQQARKYRFSGFLNPNRFAHLSDEDKALNRAGILMAGAATSFTDIADNPDPDDGIITSKEIAQLDFRGMNLAVLSACQTALGDITTDGVFGLQRGFKKAGVQSLLMSLWKVDDTAPQILMPAFYRNMAAGHSKVESLELAQQTLRNYRPDLPQPSDTITDAADP
ncbi:MAG: CHAT domain-containing protein, partial [Muribaculaceae bacterium]|nr:CHAT domain-containing protein [Muribaculaceae bacterium]